MTNMNTNANTDKIIDFLDDLTNKVGEGKHITLLLRSRIGLTRSVLLLRSVFTGGMRVM